MHADHGHRRTTSGRSLTTALALTIVFAVIEVVAGIFSGSLALLGDAAHMVTDSIALGIGAVAAWLSNKPANRRYSYGLRRAEVLGGFINAAFMIAVVVWIAVEAVDRLKDPIPIDGLIVVVVGSVGLVINLAVIRILRRGEQDMNVAGAMLHVFGDLLGSAAAVTAGIVIWATGWLPIDPLLSLLISALVLFSAIRLALKTGNVLMEGASDEQDVDRAWTLLTEDPQVHQVSDLHVWMIGSGTPMLSAHLEIESLGDWPAQQNRLRKRIASELGISHVTLEPIASHADRGGDQSRHSSSIGCLDEPGAN